MRFSLARPVRPALLILTGMGCLSCANSEPTSPPPPPAATGAGPVSQTTADSETRVATRGSIEVTARLLEIPEGAIFKRDLYDYATVLEYKVLQVHRGKPDGDIIYVGHYDPFKPRAKASDERVPDVGGNLKAFRAGQVHHMALEVPIDDYFMGGIVDKYHGQHTGPIYWAVWTDLVSE
ncbi:MAG TPA: hypothetical protein VFF52_09570 [Isosphaeraceae bacterium]|nr:hypothetical protein [Isosphaeraceae bacterium]